MNYHPMVPPFPIKPFDEMTKKEAELHFSWFIHEIPNRIELLKKIVSSTGEANEKKLDLSPESLKTLWEWFLPYVKFQKKSKQEIEEEVKNYPLQFKDIVQANQNKISYETLAIGLDVAVYFGEVFIKVNPKVQWSLITKPKSLFCVNQPVLIGFSSSPLEPTLIVKNKIIQVGDGNKNPNTLYDLFYVWIKNVI